MFCQNCGNKLKPNIKICPQCGYGNSQSRKIGFLPIFLITLFILALGLTTYGYFNKKFKLNTLYLLGVSKKSYCDFEIKDTKEFRLGPNSYWLNHYYNIYLSSDENDRFSFFGGNQKEYWRQRYEQERNKRTIYYEGIIKNNSSYPQFLVNIKTKLTTKDGVIIKDTVAKPDINKLLYPGDSIEFKTSIDLESEEEVNRFFKNENKDQITNFYPWFETCDY